jgi:Anti-sigma-28 factor, FlgM.
MRIDSIPPKELLSQYIHVREKVTVDSPVSSTDQAELTSEARTFSAALKAAKDAIGVRSPEEQKHIGEVAQSLANGTYSVPGEKVAQKILGK